MREISLAMAGPNPFRGRTQEQLADVHKIRGDKLGEAKALNNAGNLYFSIKNPKAALPYFERALGLFGELGDKNARIPTLHNLGATLVELGENEKALAYFQEVAQLSKVGGEKKIEADALFQIAFIQELNGERDQALSSYTLALGLRRQLGDKFGEGSALSGIGLIQYKKEEYRSALESFEAAGECYRVSGAKLPESLAIVNAGNAYYALEDGPKGRQKYAAALVRAKESGERSIEYDVLDRISKSFEEWGDMEGALQSAEAAHALFRSSTDKTAQMKAIYNVTRLQTDLGRYQQAAALLLEALKAASEAKEGEQEFRATRGLGFVYEIARDHQQALARYSEALALARTLGRQGEEAEMLLAVGRMNGKLGATNSERNR